MPRQITAEMRAIICADEGLRLTSYRDSAGVWTIGYGHTASDLYAGMTITAAEALAFLDADVARFEVDVDTRTHDVATSDNQFSAMVSLSYNIGSRAFAGSSVLREHRDGNADAAGAAFLLWDKSHIDGALVVLPGLLRRRQQERAIYLLPDAQLGAPSA